jgi:hypothetical protein
LLVAIPALVYVCSVNVDSNGALICHETLRRQTTSAG